MIDYKIEFCEDVNQEHLTLGWVTAQTKDLKLFLKELKELGYVVCRKYESTSYIYHGMYDSECQHWLKGSKAIWLKKK